MTRSRVVANGSGLSTAPPRTLRECRTARTLVEAFGPYAHLDSVSRRDPDRLVGVSIAVLAALTFVLLLSGVLR